ncbi:MAG: Crp/Fnr family transcriptional regulator [Flavobacteriales bacterium]|nr:Crp/Fnr family transcriptional regulator [Flavobacteriales bacterium]
MLSSILKKSFDPFFIAPIEAWQEFARYCEPTSFEKDEVMKEMDATEKYFYFILSGSAGIFLWKENNFVCLDFAFDHSFCCDYMSLLLKKSTPLQLVALEKSEMVRIKSEDFYKLGQTPVGQVIVQISAETSFIEKQQQQIELLTKNAEERYRILLEKFPDIQNRVAQKHIASYLGITPQSLSRIRKSAW